MSFRDRFFTPRVADAITSPSAIVVAGAAAAIGIVIGLGFWSIGLAVLAYGARVLAAVPRAGAGTGARISSRSLDSPWRQAMHQVTDARRRFDDAISGAAEGPLKERLEAVALRLDTAVAEAWRIAQAGQVLSRGRKQIDTTRIQSDLDYARSRPGGSTTAETIAAMEAQLGSAARLDTTIQQTYDQLVLLDARTDEAVARAVELSVSQTDDRMVGELDSDVGLIVSDLEALREAIEETHGGAQGRGGLS